MTEEPPSPLAKIWWYRVPSGEIYGPYDDVEFDRYDAEGRFDSGGRVRRGDDPSPWEPVDVARKARRSPPPSSASPSEFRSESSQPTSPPLEPPVEDPSGVSSISRVVFVLLALLPALMLSVFGIHNLVAGYTGRGVTQLILSLMFVWGMGCISLALPPTICLSAVVWIGLVVWSIVEASTVTHDAKGRRFSS
jgi:hypothetical protein